MSSITNSSSTVVDLANALQHAQAVAGSTAETDTQRAADLAVVKTDTYKDWLEGGTNGNTPTFMAAMNDFTLLNADLTGTGSTFQADLDKLSSDIQSLGINPNVFVPDASTDQKSAVTAAPATTAPAPAASAPATAAPAATPRKTIAPATAAPVVAAAVPGTAAPDAAAPSAKWAAGQGAPAGFGKDTGSSSVGGVNTNTSVMNIDTGKKKSGNQKLHDYTRATEQVGDYSVSYSQRNDHKNSLTIKDKDGHDITPPQMKDGQDGTIALPNGAIVNVTGSGVNAHLNIVNGSNFQYMAFNGSGQGHNTTAMSGTADQFFENAQPGDISASAVYTTAGDSNNDTSAWLKSIVS